MFYYFGYGSNMSVVSLRAKGVVPLSSEPAILDGWRLAFDIPDFFRIEGGTGNIRRREGDVVHGVLHGCRSSDLATLDKLEAVGVSYERIETSVRTYNRRRARAYVYVGITQILDETCLPSERYRNILVNGATDMRLDSAYVDRLRLMPTCAPPAPRPFEPPSGPGEVFTLESLSCRPSLMAFAGAVFDMSRAPARHDYLKSNLGGKDVTLLFLRRMDTSDGTEAFERVREGRFSPVQRAYVDAYLHEFAREYAFAGTIDYGVHTPADASFILGVTGARDNVQTRRPDSWRPTYVLGSRPPARLCIASREVLSRAEATREQLGHQNLGFLSETFGFMPEEQPKLALPSELAALDQVAAALPALYRTLRLRSEIASLPVLDCSPAHLPDAYVLRAAAVLAILSHAYHYVETHPPSAPAPALAEPWAQVRARLGRGAAVLTYIDLIVYNWRLIDPLRPDPLRLDNMRLLLPTVDNGEERTFYLTQAEILAHASPIVGAVVRAQEAVVMDDQEMLESELLTIIGCLQRIVRESLLNINPSPRGSSHVDPVVWAKTVAPFAVPTEADILGPSGTSSPIFNTLDIFFGRKKYQTFLGKEIYQLRATYPPFWREFLAALDEVSVGEYVASRGNAHLRGLFQEAVAVYAGPNGFLGRHRMKVYGYIDIAFKVGRSVTIGGFKGLFKDRTWDLVDSELERARVERTESFPQSCFHVRIKRVESTERVSHVVLDVAGTGIRYEAGDRCGVLPENSDELVEKTRSALGAQGDEEVRLTKEWCDAVHLRAGHASATSLTVDQVLRFGRLRPVLPRVVEALHAATQHPSLKDRTTLESHPDWEVWDLLEHLARQGVDVGALWRSPAGKASDALCRLVPPEAFRMYSISSVMSAATTEAASELHLTVGRLRYASPEREGAPSVDRAGAASSFLATARGRAAPLSIIIQHPPRFGLPLDPRTPIVMLAGGTGVSPFRGFLVERLRQLDAGKAWLFLGLRAREDFSYADELVPGVRAGNLQLRVAFSRDDCDVRYRPEIGAGELVYEAGTRRHVPDLLEDEETARTLDGLIRAGACVYVCGHHGFASTVTAAIRKLMERFMVGSDAERRDAAQNKLEELAGDGRFMQEIFSGDAVKTALPELDVSQIARHNDEQRGYWSAIDGRVFDLTEFVRLHPGGLRVLTGYAGMDASDAYARAHEGKTEIDAMREMYAVGTVRRLALEGVSGVVQGPTGPQIVSLAAAHRAWVALLYLVVEMQNALRNDQSLQNGETTRDEPVLPRSIYRLQKAVETHERFLRSYLDGLASESLPNLWSITQGLFAPDREVTWMHDAIGVVHASHAARFSEALVTELYAFVQQTIGDAGSGEADVPRLSRACEILAAEDLRLLGQIKDTLLAGVATFEELGRTTQALGSDRLVGACETLPDALEAYFARVCERLSQQEGWLPTSRTRAPPRRRRPSSTPARSSPRGTTRSPRRRRTASSSFAARPFRSTR
jgi:sulfite reductase alpha subunit-like flavoprotein